jgi:hypothetical protein
MSNSVDKQGKQKVNMFCKILVVFFQLKCKEIRNSLPFFDDLGLAVLTIIGGSVLCYFVGWGIQSIFPGVFPYRSYNSALNNRFGTGVIYIGLTSLSLIVLFGLYSIFDWFRDNWRKATEIVKERK